MKAPRMYLGQKVRLLTDESLLQTHFVVVLHNARRFDETVDTRGVPAENSRVWSWK